MHLIERCAGIGNLLKHVNLKASVNKLGVRHRLRDVGAVTLYRTAVINRSGAAESTDGVVSSRPMHRAVGMDRLIASRL